MLVPGRGVAAQEVNSTTWPKMGSTTAATRAAAQAGSHFASPQSATQCLRKREFDNRIPAEQGLRTPCRARRVGWPVKKMPPRRMPLMTPAFQFQRRTRYSKGRRVRSTQRSSRLTGLKGVRARDDHIQAYGALRFKCRKSGYFPIEILAKKPTRQRHYAHYHSNNAYRACPLD